MTLEYNPDTGLFRHVPPCGNRARRDWYTGCEDNEGRAYAVWYDGKTQPAHRVAWKLVTGKYPEATIDHINGNPKDNRWCNLRDVSQRTNCRNISKPRKHSSTGVLGVSPRGGKYRAQITVDGVSVYLGLFPDTGTAKAAYDAAKAKYHYDI